MITTAIPELNTVRPLVREPEFEVRAPHSAPGLIVSPLHVRTSDGQVLLNWSGQTSQTDRVISTDRILNGFVATAEKAIARFPNNAHAYVSLGVALLKLGEVDRAINALDRALELQPNDELALLTLGDGLFLRGDFDKAEGVFSRCLLGRSPERAALGLAASAARRGDFEKARDSLLSALADFPRSSDLNFMLGLVELRRGDLNNAIRAIRLATKLAVRNPIYRQSLAVAYALKRDYQRAENAFRAALALSPNSIDTIQGLAQVLADKGNMERVIELLAPVVEANATNVQARQLLAHAYVEHGRYSLGRAHLKHILQENRTALKLEQHVNLVNALAVAFLRGDQTEEAELAFKRATEIGPKVSSVPYENLGRLNLYYLDRPDEAIRVLNVSKQHFPKAQTTRVLLASALVASEEVSSALGEVEPFWSDGSAEESTFVCLGWLYQQVDPWKAIVVLSDGLKRFPGSPHLLNNLAYTYLMDGNVEAAEQALARVPKRAQRQLELIATEGLLKLWQGHENQGRKLYEEAEAMAVAAGRSREFVSKVKQKKYLELARFFLRKGEQTRARVEIEHGLKQKVFSSMSFKRDLEDLRFEMQRGSGCQASRREANFAR
jgi:tetratricopeptide (TPR) repeat protein